MDSGFFSRPDTLGRSLVPGWKDIPVIRNANVELVVLVFCFGTGCELTTLTTDSTLQAMFLS